ncbi:carbon-nitrogen hydrolase family protein [Piscinibacter sakaiensis]|uniref:carbon-nitrogen hydrolase family protein n=1 Tax=Piscinibacter sakaiensis TaxID=1547922 RepID=UPI003AAC1C2C
MVDTIALVQFQITPFDPAGNLARMEAHVAEAAAAGAQIVVFPEDAVTGPLDAQAAYVDHAAEYLAFFQRLAARHCIDIVPGSWTTREAAALFNTTHYINSDGGVAGSYRKINLWPTEKALLTPGNAVSVFPTAHGLVGLVICWDLSFAPLFTEMKRQGAGLVIAPAYWSFTPQAIADPTLQADELQLIDSLCTVRAFENDLVVAYCNAAGVLGAGTATSVLSGRSQICHPLLKTLCKAQNNAEQMLIGQLAGAAVAA